MHRDTVLGCPCTGMKTAHTGLCKHLREEEGERARSLKDRRFLTVLSATLSSGPDPEPGLGVSIAIQCVCACVGSWGCGSVDRILALGSMMFPTECTAS